MKEVDLIQLMAKHMSSNTMDEMFQYFAADCEYYSSGVKRATGKEEVCAFFMKRKTALNRAQVPCFAYPAKVEKSEDNEISVGSNCMALAQFDRYNCVGFMIIQTGFMGKIKRFSFHTTPKVTFKVTAPGKYNISKVPEDAHDAIGYRAIALGIMDEHVILSKHFQKYEMFQSYVQKVYEFILKNTYNNFNAGITNAAGYLYITAMATALQKQTGTSLFEFNEKDATNGITPRVERKYQKWIDTGYDTGKKLFFGFTEYANLREPKEEIFQKQLRQAFMDMLLYGSIQANKDADMGLPIQEMACLTELSAAICNLRKSQSQENITKFAEIFAGYVKNGTWVPMAGENSSKGFAIDIINQNGLHFATMYTAPSEKQRKGIDIVIADINKLIDAVFSNSNIDGICIDPDTTSFCMEKHFILKCVLHGGYPIQNNGGCEQRDWGTGIPQYTEQDLMTQGELQNFAINTVLQYEKSIQQGYQFVSACDYPGAMPTIIFKNKGEYLFIYIKAYAELAEPKLSETEKNELLALGRKYDGHCFWAPVGFLSTDSERFHAELALKGDGFYCNYKGLQAVL